MRKRIDFNILLLLSKTFIIILFFGMINHSAFSAADHEHGKHESLDSELGHEENIDSHHDEHAHDSHHEESNTVQLTDKQISIANIVVIPLLEKNTNKTINAPGEVYFNAYKSKKITPRIRAQVMRRHMRLGQSVKRGTVMVSLSSVEMAQAQGELIVTDREWKRIKNLGNSVVTDRRYIQSKIARQQAYAKVLAYGMTKSQADQLIKSKDPSKAVGQFNLLALQDGTITFDDFIEGEIIEVGQVLFEITDESSMWVEARLTPNAVTGIKSGNTANVIFNEMQYAAKVVQIHHQLDEATRTIAIRLEVDNINDTLHPGLFVDTQIQSSDIKIGLALQKNAVLRNPEGKWVVITEQKPNLFNPEEIEIVSKTGDYLFITGLPINTPVVTNGAFFIMSEIAKSGFEVHNH